MRWYILRTLIYKEALRHATNRSGLALAGLLITASLLLAIFNPAGDKTSSFIGGIHHCYIDSEEHGDWWTHLQANIPDGMKKHLIFRKFLSGPSANPDAVITYPTGTGAIQIRKLVDPDQKVRYVVWLWYPNGDRHGMSIYENWFWKTTHRYLEQQALAKIQTISKEAPSNTETDDSWMIRKAFQELKDRIEKGSQSNGEKGIPDVEIRESPLIGSTLDSRAAIATALVMFALFFTCVYLMPSLNCEERERGLLLAQALSPASTLELLTAKFFFYPAFGILLATLLAGIHNSMVLTNHFFWLTMFTLAVGSLGIGVSISSLAKSQRSASMGALCYMLVIALVLLVCQQNNIPYVPFLAIEYHAPHILHAILTNQIHSSHWFNLLACAVLSFGWVFLAAWLFRKRGWQ